MFTLGTDPEVLCTQAGSFKSAVGLLPGTKNCPVDVGIGKVHVDNVAGEFNTPPASNKAEFDSFVQRMLDETNRLLIDVGLELSDKTTGEYSDEDLDHPDAMVGGCEVDYNAYSGELNPPPDLIVYPIRSAGGHLHIGTELADEDKPKLIKALDFFFTIPALVVDCPMRRHLYGKAGSFRYKKYGVEYRTPGNFWIFSSERRQWAYDRVAEAIDNFKRGVELPKEVPEIIDNHKLEAADDFVRQFNLTPVPM